MDRTKFLNCSMGIAFKWFVFLGPLIGGLIISVDQGLFSEINFLVILMIPMFSYVGGIFPATISAILWGITFNIIHYLNPNILFRKPKYFIFISALSSLFYGYIAVLLFESMHATPVNHSLANIGAISGCISGFMAANRMLKETRL